MAACSTGVFPDVFFASSMASAVSTVTLVVLGACLGLDGPSIEALALAPLVSVSTNGALRSTRRMLRDGGTAPYASQRCASIVARMHARLAVSLFLVGCSCGSHDAPAPTTTAPPPSASGTPPASTTAPEPAPAAHAAPLDAAARLALAAAMREGRRAQHAGDLTAALTSFEHGVEIAPTSARVRCEAAFAAFQAGNLDRADEHVRVAMAGLPRGDVPDRLRVPTAQCLYNAGLVYQARDRAADAADAFRRSIALRPNDVVQQALDALNAPPPDPGAWARLGPFDTLTSIADVATAIRDSICASIREDAGLDSCDQLEATIADPVRAEGPTPIEATTIDYSTGEWMYTVLVVRGAGTTLAGGLMGGYSANMGNALIDEMGAIASADDVVTGGSAEIVVRAHAEAHDDDDGVCDSYSNSAAMSIVCSTDDGTLSCAAWPLMNEHRSEHDDPCTGWDEDESDTSGTTAPVTATIDVTGYELTQALNGGHVVLTAAGDWPGATTINRVTPPLTGDQDLRALLGRADLAWPARWVAVDVTPG